MKVVSTNGNVQLFNNHIKVYDELPARAYIVRFSQIKGFFLQEYPELEIHENKIYGVHASKVEKCLSAFKRSVRNIGVILSGPKGIGKSLFAKLLASEAIKKGLPLIVVDCVYDGLPSFIQEIDQEVVVLFDEFDKITREVDSDAPGAQGSSSQVSLLSLFDGVCTGKKLYVITCNELAGLSDYLINRTGRFHYHFRFEYPEGDEIVQYLQDKIPATMWGEIPKVVSFSRRVNLTYDSLRSIAFEIEGGEPFETAIKDLNLINTECSRYKLVLTFNDGAVSMVRRGVSLDMFDDEDCESIWLKDATTGRLLVEVEFCPTDAQFDMESGVQYISGDKLFLRYSEDLLGR